MKGTISEMPKLAADICQYIANNIQRMDIIFFYDRCVELKQEDAEFFSDRIIRCILFLSKGDTRKMEEAVCLAKEDYRDLIVAAEYNGSDQRVRNFNLPFSQEIIDQQCC
ncbi:MAG: hypothetical protein K8S27_13565 [Candidatus Omnitrophica bacterium]|nr:hypothetical protein [Candidatus Omnitrophota bacterium]